MKINIRFILINTLLMSCGAGVVENVSKPNPKLLTGTWQFIKGTLILVTR